ncbi:MAG: hypothetical protein AB7G68_01635 [Nitrospiraceae bacterium]
MSDDSNELQTSQVKPLIYTNWRGKTFVIDQLFVDDIKRWCEANGLEAGELDYLTPEMLMEWLPTMESLERRNQLEEMWDQVSATDQ